MRSRIKAVSYNGSIWYACKTEWNGDWMLSRIDEAVSWDNWRDAFNLIRRMLVDQAFNGFALDIEEYRP